MNPSFSDSFFGGVNPMPGQTVALTPDQGTTAHLILKDATGQVTTDRGIYQNPVWAVDNPLIVAINAVGDATGVQFSCQVQSAVPTVEGSASVSVTMSPSDPTLGAPLTDSFVVTIAAVPGPVVGLEIVIDPAGPRLF